MSNIHDSENEIGNILKIISGAILILGIIAGIIFAVRLEEFKIFIYFLVGSFITSVIYAGFSEIINLLQELVDIEYFSASKIENLERKVSNQDSSNRYEKTPSEGSSKGKPSHNRPFDLDQWKKDNT